MDRTSKKKELSHDEAPMIVRNTSGKHVIWDQPSSGQSRGREGPLPDSIRFGPDGSTRATPEQLSRMGKPPPGVIVERYDERRHGKKDRMG